MNIPSARFASNPQSQPEHQSASHAGLSEHIRQYLEWMRIQNYSERTIEARVCYLGRFRAWCSHQGISLAQDVSPSALESYRKFLHGLRRRDGHPLSFRTHRNILVPLRSFFRWLHRRREIPSNPTADMEMPRMDKPLPRAVLSAREMECVLRAPEVNARSGIRDRAILEVFYSTGMRRAELAALERDDIDRGRGLVTIHKGKGGRDRIVPIGRRAVFWVERYLRTSRPELLALGGLTPDQGSPFRTLFLDDRGLPWRLKQLSAMVSGYVREARLRKSGSCHLFRHTCATLMLENDADIRFIQQLLGHACLATTEIYTRVSLRKLKEVHMRTHPAERKGNRERR